MTVTGPWLLLFALVFSTVSLQPQQAWGQQQQQQLEETETETIADAIADDEDDGSMVNVDSVNSVIHTTNCPIVGFLPFTSFGKSYPSYQVPRNSDANADNTSATAPAPPYAVTHAAAALMAVDHFNARSDVLIPELSTYTLNCSVHINELFLANTDSREGTTPKLLLEYWGTHDQIAPCAVVGGYSSIPTQEAATVAHGMETLVVTHGADYGRLTNPKTPEVARTNANQHPTGEAIVNWLRSHNRTDFLAVLYTTGGGGTAYSESLDNAAIESNFSNLFYTSAGPPYTGMEPNHSIRYSMLAIQKTTYRTIVVILNEYQEKQLQLLADAAEELQMNTPEYVWVFVFNLEQSLDEFVAYGTKNQNSTKLLKGSAVVRTLDGATLEESNFQTVWNQQDESFVQRLNEILPNEYAVSSDYFQQYLPEPGAGYMYDTIMAVGMGKCQEEKTKTAIANGGGGGGNANASGGNRRNQESRRRRRRLQQITKAKGEPKLQLKRKLQKKEEILSPHMAGITSLEFTGVTGTLVWNERRKRNRQRNLMEWGVYNIREIKETDRERMEEHFPTQNFTLWYYLTDILQGGPVDGQWTKTKDGPFLFRDGTSVPPKLLRSVPEQNYLTSSVRITGLTLMAISLFLSILVTILVWLHQEKPSIKRNQPFFLYLLLMGTFLMAWSILFLSFDESTLSGEQDLEEPPFLDVACALFPWFLSLGYVLVYGALFMKLWRINRVLQTTRLRVKIGVKQVVWPFAALLGISIVVLTAWTTVEPWQWERNPVDENEPWGESYGQCASSHDLVSIIILGLIMLLATVLTGLMAWRTKDIDATFSESNWIFTTIVLQFQVLVVGIPILVILNQQSADATYMGRVLLISTMTMSTLILMFGPKLVPILFPNFALKFGATNRGSLVSGGVRVSGGPGSKTGGNVTTTSRVSDTRKSDTRKELNSNDDGRSSNIDEEVTGSV